MATLDGPRLAPAHWRDPWVLLATGFGSGFLRPMPGTWGSLAALILWWWLLADLPWLWQLAVAAVTFGAGCWLTGRLWRRYGISDDPAIVIDEFVGLWITLLAVPATPVAMALGFVLFRAFDIAKPGPVRWADRRPGVLGVMLDDLVAGGLAAVVLQLALWALGGLMAAPTP